MRSYNVNTTPALDPKVTLLQPSLGKGTMEYFRIAARDPNGTSDGDSLYAAGDARQRGLCAKRPMPVERNDLVGECCGNTVSTTFGITFQRDFRDSDLPGPPSGTWRQPERMDRTRYVGGVEAAGDPD
jgi:hypothetical protein